MKRTFGFLETSCFFSTVLQDENKKIIDVSTIDKGVYLLKISSANQYRTLKLIKK